MLIAETCAPWWQTLYAELLPEVVVCEVLDHVEGRQSALVGEIDRADGSGELQGRSIQLGVALTDPHERTAHREAHRALLTGKGLANVFDVLEEESVFRRFPGLELGHFVQQTITAKAPPGVFTVYPIAREFNDEGRLGEGGIAGTEHVGEPPCSTFSTCTSTCSLVICLGSLMSRAMICAS